jgi:DNA polymerase
MTSVESEEAVNMYRGTYPKVVAYWRGHHQWLQLSANHNDPTHEVQLASGRVQTYFRPRYVEGQIVAETVRGLPARKLYGGLLTENEIQATARDIFCDAWLAVVHAGHRVLWTMHDELVIELPEDKAAALAPEIVHLMKTASPWAKGCPIDVEYAISKHYMK